MIQASLSFWEKNSFFKDIDIAIIGSGIVGLSAALYIKEKQPELNVVIFERGTLPMGASTRNAGFACFGSISELLEDMKSHSEDEVLELLLKRWDGLQRLRQRIGDTKMGYLPCGGYELFKPEDKTLYSKCKAALPFFNNKLEKLLGVKEVYRVEDGNIGSFGFQGVQHMILNRSEGQIDTGKMMHHLLQLAYAKNIKIYNGITINAVKNNKDNVCLQTEAGWEINASKVLVATNGFANQLLNLEVQAARNQVLITKPISSLPVRGTFHYDKGYFYFRNVGKRILFGGGRHLSPDTEMTADFGTTTLIQQTLTKLLAEVILPNTPFEIDSWWSGILGVGDQKNPIVKKVTERVGVAVRMGGMGIAIGSLIGEEGGKLLIG